MGVNVQYFKCVLACIWLRLFNKKYHKFYKI